MVGGEEAILRFRNGDLSFDTLMGVLTIRLRFPAFGVAPYRKDDVLLMAMAPARRAPNGEVIRGRFGGYLVGRVVEVREWKNNGVLGVSLEVILDGNDVKPTDWAFQNGLYVKRVPGVRLLMPGLSVGTGVAVCGAAPGAPEREHEGVTKVPLRRLDFDGDGEISMKESKEFIAAARRWIVDGLGFGDVRAALPEKITVTDVQYLEGIRAKSSLFAGIDTVIKRLPRTEDAYRPMVIEIFGKENLNMVGKMYDNETDKVVLRNFRDVVEEARAYLTTQGQSGWVNMIDIVSTDGIKVVDSKQVEKIVKIKRGDKMGYRLVIAESATPGQVESRTPEGLYENCLLYWMGECVVGCGERVVG